jgi:hypothetical protein
MGELGDDTGMKIGAQLGEAPPSVVKAFTSAPLALMM